ncbi:AAA family ATPase [bacterium]|nr:AAA family ATPase [bacterium]
MSYLLHPVTRQKVDGIGLDSAHGFLFAGPSYLYKDRAAEDVAVRLVGAESVEASPNITIVTPEEKSKIKIEVIKKLRDSLALTAYDATHPRVVIIKSAEQLTAEAANALLKTLEEPGDKVIFILVTNRLSMIPATVRSRLQLVSFIRPNRDQLAEYLREQSSDSFDIDQIWRSSAGLPRLAVQLLTELDGELGGADELARQYIDADLIRRFSISMDVAKQGIHRQFLVALERLVAGNIAAQGWARIGEHVIRAQQYIETNIAPRLVLEHLSLELEV